MSLSLASNQVPSPRMALVLAGAASTVGRASTALEHAVMPQLASLGRAGRTGRLRTLADHLPISEATAAAALLGTVPPMAIDPGAIAAESLGAVLAADEGCTVVEVLDGYGEPAPALDVQRAVEALRHQLPWQRIVGVRRGHEVLLAGAVRPTLPQLEGLRLVAAEPGYLPAPVLDHGTVVIAAEGSTILGVAAMLGALAISIDASRSGRHDPLPARLREEAIAALIGGARSVVVESRAPLDARRSMRDRSGRERAVCSTLERLDRELVGPLRSAAVWTDACLSVCADLPRTPAGQPLRGEVPLVMSGPRSVFLPEPAPLLAPLGTALPPRHSERGIAVLPVVSSPFTLLPARSPGAPRRFTADPLSGRTLGAELALL